MPTGIYPRTEENIKRLTEQLKNATKKQPKHAMKFSTPQQLEIRVASYFEHQDREKQPYTITGLALYLDISRTTLLKYAGRSAYGKIVRRGKMKCEEYAEKQLFLAKNPVGIIFNLKNNYGWRDATEVKHTGGTMNKIIIERPAIGHSRTIMVPAVIERQGLEDKRWDIADGPKT